MAAKTTITAVEALRMMKMYPEPSKRRRGETKLQQEERHKAAIRARAQMMRRKYNLKMVWREDGQKEFSYSKEELQAALRNKGKVLVR